MSDEGKSREHLLDKEKILELFAPQGVLSGNLPRFESRPEQKAMVGDIIDAFNLKKIALIEAGTGTGKSLAYLLPSLLKAHISGKRTVISTNTINLQEQLLHKDIPLLTRALGLELKAVLVKGMSNYHCLRKHEDAMEEMQLLNAFEAEEMATIDSWKEKTTDGTRSTLPMVPSSATWEKVMAEGDACTGKQCEHYERCFFFKARAKANQAHILIVNHHLLFADLAARAETENFNDACILPHYANIVLDEAHNIEDIATDFFAHHINQIHVLRTLSRLGSDARGRKQQGKLPALETKLNELINRSATPETDSLFLRLQSDLPGMKRQLTTDFNALFRILSQFARTLAPPAQFGETGSIKARIKEETLQAPLWQKEVVTRTQQLSQDVQRYIYTFRSLSEDIEALEDESIRTKTQGLRADIRALTSRLESTCEKLHKLVESDSAEKVVKWLQILPGKRGETLHAVSADLDITQALTNHLFKRFPTVILCSATLTTHRSFSFIRHQLGLTANQLEGKEVIEAIYDPPFDYSKQALLAIPSDLPPPNAPSFNQKAAEAIWKLIQGSRGNSFVLFTSYSSMRSCFQWVAEKSRGSTFTLMKQGDKNRRELLDAFRQTDQSVLFGTDSFWEGVDVQGEALRQVIIVKLPFRVPSEPIIEARAEAILKSGGKPFGDYSLPNAIVKFKQGFGRLIRNRKDRGAIICLDNRLTSKGYGQGFLNSLPPCTRVVEPMEKLEKTVKEFYRKTYYLTK